MFVENASNGRHGLPIIYQHVTQRKFHPLLEFPLASLKPSLYHLSLSPNQIKSKTTNVRIAIGSSRNLIVLPCISPSIMGKSQQTHRIRRPNQVNPSPTIQKQFNSFSIPSPSIKVLESFVNSNRFSNTQINLSITLTPKSLAQTLR